MGKEGEGFLGVILKFIEMIEGIMGLIRKIRELRLRVEFW